MRDPRPSPLISRSLCENVRGDAHARYDPLNLQRGLVLYAQIQRRDWGPAEHGPLRHVGRSAGPN